MACAYPPKTTKPIICQCACMHGIWVGLGCLPDVPMCTKVNYNHWLCACKALLMIIWRFLCVPPLGTLLRNSMVLVARLGAHGPWLQLAMPGAQPQPLGSNRAKRQARTVIIGRDPKTGQNPNTAIFLTGRGTCIPIFIYFY